MSVEQTRRAWAVIEQTNLSAPARITLAALADFVNKKDGGCCYPGQRRLCARTGLGETAQRTAIRALKDAGWLDTEPRFRPEGRGRTSDLYRLLLPPVDQPSPDEGYSADQPSFNEGLTLASRATNPRLTSDQPSRGEGHITVKRTREREPFREPVVATSPSPSENENNNGAGRGKGLPPPDRPSPTRVSSVDARRKAIKGRIARQAAEPGGGA